MSINVPTGEIRSAGASLSEIAGRMQKLSNRAGALSSAIAGCYMQGGVGSRPAAAASRLQAAASQLRTRADSLTKAAGIYEKAENELLQRGYQVAAAIGGSYSAVWAQNTFLQQLPEGAVCKAPSTWDKVKSIGKKVFKTGGAVVSIVGAAGATVASWTVAAATGGIAVGGAALVSVYSANTIANKATDLYNLWAGDESQVGEVNYLKSGAATLGGNISEALGGGREIGELIGKGVYTGGEITSTVLSVRNVDSVFGSGGSNWTTTQDDIIQNVQGKSPFAQIGKLQQESIFDVSHDGTSFWNTAAEGIKEIPKAIGGYADIAWNTPLEALKYDHVLLGYEIENLKKCKSVIESAKSVYDTGKSIYDTASDLLKSVIR